MTHRVMQDVFVMIVDDQLEGKDGRKGDYEKCLEKLNHVLKGKWNLFPKFCQNVTEVTRIVPEPEQTRLAIIDMVLDEPAWNIVGIKYLDKRLRSECWPLLLVSAHFGADEALERANGLLADNGQQHVTSQFVNWSTFKRGKEGLELDNLAIVVDFVLSRSYKQDMMFKRAQNEPIDVLHITDPHFGKADWNVGKLMSLKIERDKNNLKVADFLAITGDISDKGTPEHYKRAREYLEALSQNGILASLRDGELPKERVFLCPGNHDFSRPIALAANIEEIEKIDKSKDYVLRNGAIEKSEWIGSYAWCAYEAFERAVAGHKGRWITNPGFRINERFKTFGFIVLELNIEKYSIDGFTTGILDESLSQNLNQASTAVAQIRKNNECLFVLAHRNESNSWKALSQNIDNTLRGLATQGPTIFLCGHEHTSVSAPVLEESVFLVRGIPPIAGAARPHGVLPAISNIRLLRLNGAVNGIEITEFHAGEPNWLRTTLGTRRYEFRGGIWSRS